MLVVEFINVHCYKWSINISSFSEIVINIQFFMHSKQGGSHFRGNLSIYLMKYVHYCIQTNHQIAILVNRKIDLSRSENLINMYIFFPKMLNKSLCDKAAHQGFSSYVTAFWCIFTQKLICVGKQFSCLVCYLVQIEIGDHLVGIVLQQMLDDERFINSNYRTY